MTGSTCSIQGCGKPAEKRGWCAMHYWRWRNHGDPNKGARRPAASFSEAVERHLRRLVPAGDCMVVPGLVGYAEIRSPAGRMNAHRAVFMHFNGPLDEGEVVRHRCDNPPCSKLAHLERGTQAQNVRDEYARARRVEGWARGEGRPNAQLTEHDVRELRRRHLAGESIGSLASTFGVAYAAVRSAIRGESWVHITDVPPVPGRKNRVPHHAALRLTRLADASAALELSEQGKSLSEVASILNVSRSTAWKLVGIGREQVSA